MIPVPECVRNISWAAVLLVAVSGPGSVARAQSMAAREPAVAATYHVVPSAPAAYHYATLGLRSADAWKLGGFATAALLLATVDRRGDAWARHPGVQNDATLDALSKVGDKTGSVAAIVVGPALWLLGRARGDSGTAVLGLRTSEAVIGGGVTVTAIKVLAGRTRPFASLDHSPTHWDFFGGARSDSVRSFASGHATEAAAAAVVLASEWRRQGVRGWKTLGPPTVYALATLTAASRVRDREHWMSDVVSGAAVGMLSALVVRRWHDAHPHSRIDRVFLAH